MIGRLTAYETSNKLQDCAGKVLQKPFLLPVKVRSRNKTYSEGHPLSLNHYRRLKAVAIAETNGDTVAERIQQVVVPPVLLIADPKFFDLFHQVIALVSLVLAGFVKGIFSVVDLTLKDVAGHVDRTFVIWFCRSARWARKA
jgi:hypothetical protein